jgi:alginate O-acetyltransferase complex protein AlgI
MSFATPAFLWAFLPAVLLATWLAPDRARNGVVAVASLVFYAVGAGPSTLLLLACIAVNFAAGILMHEFRGLRRARARRQVMVGAVAIDVGVLAIWKYAGFASEQIRHLSDFLGLGESPVVAIGLPLGISFYTFHQISYVVDVYRGTREAQLDLVTYATYVSMFPQLIAGPIVRYSEIADQLDTRRSGKLDDLVAGFPRFCLGLTKKVVIADSLAPLVQAGFDLPPNQVSTSTAWLCVAAYTLQIYFDFSGYSDMAIGLGRMLGFQLPENFARPYSAHSITDFWRRWHMSLSRWFRDYVYIPLGGNRVDRARQYRNLWVVFLLVGLWHGANWTFVVWGAYHGSLLVLERIAGVSDRVHRLPVVVGRRIGVLLLVMIGWVVFRAASLTDAAELLGRMFSWHAGSLNPSVEVSLTNQRLACLLVGALVVVLPRRFVTGPVLQWSLRPPATALRLAYVTLGLGYATLLVAAGTFSPFLYYQF